MAINPFRVGELQLPQPLRPVPIDFSPLSQIGDAIGQYRQQQEIGSILRGSTDESGNLDIQKAAAGLGAAGHLVAANRLIDTATRQSAQQATEATARRAQDITAGHYKATEEAIAARDKAAQEEAAATLKQRQEEFKQGKIKRELITDPNTDEQFLLETGGEGGPRKFDLKTGQWQQYTPQVPTAPAPSTPGPRSEAPMPGVSFDDRFAALGDAATAAPVQAPTRVAALGDVALPGPTPAPPAAPAIQTAQATPAVPAQDLPRRGEPGGPPLLPSVKEQRSELAKKLIDQQAMATQAAEVAKDLQPHYDEAIAAWQDLMKLGGIGTIAGSAVGRLGGALLSTDAEAARQRYDTAINRIKSRISAIDFKGQGAVSNYERGLAASQFPALTTVDPAGQINFLLQGRDASRQAVEAARATSVGQRTPLLSQESPSISKRPAEVSSSAEVNALVGQAREHYQSIRDNPDYTAAQIAAVRKEILNELHKRKVPNPEILLGR